MYRKTFSPVSFGAIFLRSPRFFNIITMIL